MTRTPIKSSQIRSAGMDANSGTLEVEFTNGSVYHYPNVPMKTANEMMASPSPGKYFHSNIKRLGGKKVKA